MNHDYPVIDADVLIIGGGSAGAMAAIRAKEVDPLQKVVVFEKGHIKYSGCIARGMDALNIVAIPGLDSPELYVESNSIACHGVMDEPQAYEMAKRSFALLKKLESWDVCFPTDDQGNYETLQVHPKGKFCVTMKEPELKTILAKRLMARVAEWAMEHGATHAYEQVFPDNAAALAMADRLGFRKVYSVKLVRR